MTGPRKTRRKTNAIWLYHVNSTPLPGVTYTHHITVGIQKRLTNRVRLESNGLTFTRARETIFFKIHSLITRPDNNITPNVQVYKSLLTENSVQKNKNNTHV